MRLIGFKNPQPPPAAAVVATAPTITTGTAPVASSSVADIETADPQQSSGGRGGNAAATTTTTTTDYTAYADNIDDDDHHPTETTGLLGCLRAFSHLNPKNQSGVDPQVTLNAREQRTYDRLKKIRYWMDESVKICGRPVGLDPIVGLLPVVGDCASAVVSLVLVARAAPDLSRYTTARMLVNVWIDAVTGVVPLVGDIFDVGWKANERNVAIFEDHMKQGRQRRHDVDKAWLIGAVCFFLAFCFVCTVATIAVTVVIVLLIVRSVS